MDMFDYSIVVVDNDFRQSARRIVDEVNETAAINAQYFQQPEKNISLARNTAIMNAGGDLIAFIDDDEFPEDKWLLELFRVRERFDADGVLGPVRPHFEEQPPCWIERSGVAERKRFPTGTWISSARHTRTGNVLFRSDLFEGLRNPFDPRFGLTGGEDTDFFEKMLRNGKKFIWCDEAVVYERVPSERMSRKYFLKRALLRGAVAAEREGITFLGFLKSIAAVVIYTSMLPFLRIGGEHLFMKYLIPSCDHLGKLFSLVGAKMGERKTQDGSSEEIAGRC